MDYFNYIEPFEIIQISIIIFVKKTFLILRNVVKNKKLRSKRPVINVSYKYSSKILFQFLITLVCCRAIHPHP